MALRQPIPEITEVDLKRVFGELQTVKVFAPPSKVEFRRGANLAQVVAELDAETAVSLEAAPGAGKSTLLPLELVRGRSRLLVHLFPNRLQAYQCFDHVSNSQSAVTVKFIDDVDEELPVRGIAYMAYATFVARRISGESFADRSSTVLYLDEIHESDAYTYTVRRLARTMADVGLVVFASATDTPTGFRKSETAAKLVTKHLPACSSPDIWDPREVGQPWSISSLRGNVLIITDNDHHACKLVADYNDMGALAFRLTARVSVEHFAHIMAELNNKKGPIVVLVADSTFRSAFTFDVSLVLDTCYVTYYEVTDGVLERRSRTANVGERYQAAHRAARIAGQDAVYYDIDDEPGNYSVNLEGVEADAAALLFRALGYQPPAEIMASAMAIGRFPIDLTGMLNDMQPVVLVASEHFTTGFEFQHQTEGAPLPVNSLGIGMMADGVRESKSMEDINRAIDECDVSSAPEGFRGVLNFVHAEPDEAFNPETGRYYTVSGIPAKPRCTASFPRGLDSVIKLMSQNRNPQVVVDHMTMDDRADALSLLLMRYNTATAELRAVSALLRSLPGEAIDAVHHREVKQWVSDTLEAAHSLDITVATVADCMQWFGRYYFFRPYDDMPDVEAHYAEVHKQKLAQFVNLNETDASDYKQQLHGILKYPGRKRVKFSGADARAEQQQSVVATRTSRSSSSTSGGSLTEIGDKMRAPMPRWTGIRYAEAEVVGTKRDKKGNIVREIAVTNKSKNLWGDFMSAVVNSGNKRYITKS